VGRSRMRSVSCWTRIVGMVVSSGGGTPSMARESGSF
jgi:hypothetical protein